MNTVSRCIFPTFARFLRGMLLSLAPGFALIRSSTSSYRLDIKIVPILVGAINYDKEVSYGKLLAPYLAAKDTIFVISSDFCHWYDRQTSRVAQLDGSM